MEEQTKKRKGWPKGKKRGPRKNTVDAQQVTSETPTVPAAVVEPSPAPETTPEVQAIEPTKRGRKSGVKAVEEKAPKQAKIPAGFNILQRGPKINEALQESLARSEKQARLIVSDPNKPRLLIPVIPFQIQMALKARGLTSGTTMEIFGQESVGKTTFRYTIYGWGMRHNCACADFGAEAKPMDSNRVKQCLHFNKEISQMMYDSIYRKEVHDIVSLVDEAESWLIQIRDPRNRDTYVPLSIPAIIGIDPWNQLMDPGEAGSFAAYGGPPTLALKQMNKPAREKTEKAKAKEREKAKKEAAKIKDIGAGSNLGSAKLAAAWCRRLPHILATHNAMVIVVRGQTEKLEMSARSGGSFLSAEDLAPYNNQSRGGRSFQKLSAYELILTPGKQIKRVIDGQDVVVGKDTRVNINKNSYGPPYGKFTYRINTAAYRDNDVFQDMSIDFSHTLPEMLKSAGLDVVRYSDDDFSCKSLGVDRATAAEFEAAFYQRGDIVEDLGKRLKISGYAESDACKWPNLNPAFEAQTEEVSATINAETAMAEQEATAAVPAGEDTPEQTDQPSE